MIHSRESEFCRPPTPGRFITLGKGFDFWMLSKLRVHDFPQGADSLPVNDTTMQNSFFNTGVKVFLDELLDFTWLETVKVKGSRYGDFYGVARRSLIHSGNWMFGKAWRGLPFTTLSSSCAKGLFGSCSDLVDECVFLDEFGLTEVFGWSLLGSASVRSSLSLNS